MKTKSVRTYPQANIEALAEVSSNPRDIVSELEEAFMRNFLAPAPYVSLMPKRALTDIIANDPVMGSMAEQIAAFRERRFLAKAKWAQRSGLYAAFGRYGLEKDEKAIIAKAKEGLESVEDRLAAVCYAIDKIRSRKEWKKEQNKPQEPGACLDMCLTYDLPPRTKGKSHQPAYYSITGPKGHTIDLSKQDRHWKPKLCKNPNEAFRAFLTRLGVSVNGGEVQLLNMLLKAPMVEITNDNGEVEKCYKWLPSYVTTNCGAWFVTVGWRLNPKCAPSSYWLDGNDQLTQRPQDEEPLTISQLDYAVLTGSSEEKLETDSEEESEPVDYLNDEEEYVLEGLMRDENEEELPVDNYVMIGYAYENNRFIEQRNNSAIWLDCEVRDYIAQQLRQIRHEKRQLSLFANDIENRLSELTEEQLDEETMQIPIELQMRWDELHKMKSRIRNLQRFFLDQLDDLKSQTSECYSQQPVFQEWTMRPTQPLYGPFQEFTATLGSKILPGRIPHNGHNPIRERPQEIENAHVMPLNEIEQPKLTRHEFKPWPTRSFQMTLDQSKQLRRQKQVAQAIIHNRFGMLIREKAAADTFAAALEGALRA